MPQQSTRHIMMMEPADFYSNPQTMETNTYQAENDRPAADINAQAIREFRAFRDTLVEHGVIVTTALGQKGCPDDIYCNNWVSTHADDKMVLYPMLADNRRLERRAELIALLKQTYDVALDISAEELDGRFLESTGSLGIDRVNKVIYCALSPRTNEDLARKAAAALGCEIEFFRTKNHAGVPVYHTDVLMFFGTGYIGCCTETIIPEDRERIVARIQKTHELVDLTMEQMRAFSGNALEVRGTNDNKMLVMSSSGHGALRDDQRDQILKYVTKIVHSDLTTIEKYGGGSARCMLLELH